MYSFPIPNAMYPPFPMQGRPPFQPTLAPPLYIGNLDDTVHEEQLFAHFSRYGPLHSLKIVKDRTTNRSRGFGYINFISPKDAENARMLSQYDKIGKSPIRLMYKRNIHDTEGTNIFVKNIDSTVTFKELHNLFAREGNVITVKIATNPRGESLGYGYVLMEKKEDAENAIKNLDGFKLKEKEISCVEFKARDKRNIRHNNNLYIKGLPLKDSEAEVQKLLDGEFSKFGKIVSLAAKQKEAGKWFAFVCYESPEAAKEAIEKLNGSTIFGSEPLYVAAHQSRHERDSELRKNYSATKNETNLYVRNLKPEVTKESLTKAFSQFGEIGNVAVGSKAIKADDVRAYGFVAFKFSADALRAQTEGPKSDDVKALFIDGQEVYVNFWQSKYQRDQFKASRTRRLANQQRMAPFGIPRGNPFSQMPADPRMMNFPYPMMNPMMGRPPYGSGPRGPQGGAPRGFQQRRGNNFQNRGTYQKTGIQNNDRYSSGPRQQRSQQGTGNRPHTQQNQGQPQATHQQAKETRNTQQEIPLEANLTVQSLKDKLDDFLKLEQDKQRNILGELLYPKILRQSRPEHAPKITGMLVDFEVLTVQDILEMLEDDNILGERISEAQELIISEGAN